MNKPVPQKPSSNSWMVVYVTHNQAEAYIIAGRLKHEEIPCMVHAPIGSSALGINIGSLGEFQVLVHPENYEMATDILDNEIDSDIDELPDTTSDISFRFNDDE